MTAGWGPGTGNHVVVVAIEQSIRVVRPLAQGNGGDLSAPLHAKAASRPGQGQRDPTGPRASVAPGERSLFLTWAPRSRHRAFVGLAVLDAPLLDAIYGL